jgi:transcriptional regulator GlxA family with amidase domain
MSRELLRAVECHDLRLARAIQYVTRDLAQRPTLAAVSKVAGLERTYFCKCFSRHFGMSFSEWNARIRVEEARGLLTTTVLSISAVALAVGYSDITTFERNFRELFAVSPRRYRQLNRRVVRNTIFAENFTRNAETRAQDR